MITRRALLIMIALLAGVWLLPAAPRPATADCATQDETQLIKDADVIFTGTVVADEAAKLGREREYTVRVDKVYKGAAFGEQIVATQAGAGLELSVQQTYLVFADYPNGADTGPVARLEGDSCQGTRPLTADHPVPAALGSGHDPSIGSSRSVTSRLTGPIWIVVGLGCMAFAIVITIRQRRLHPEQP
jgi:hypothetical protein